MKVSETAVPGVRLVEPRVFEDPRGFFLETFNAGRFAEHGLPTTFVQDNHSRSRGGVVRGLHYQGPAGAQWRLVRCTVGEIYDVVVDIQVDSPTFGQWIGVRLSADNRSQLLIPPAYAHGFAVVSDVAEVQYKCTGLHQPEAERAMAYDDPELAIVWPVEKPITSAKDAAAPSFQDYRANPDFPAGWDR